MRRSPIGDGAVLLPDRQEGLPRHLVLPRHEKQVRRRRRFRLRLRRRAPDRTSRAGRARHSPQGRDYEARVSQTQANALSVRVELQADCLAGVWANHANDKWKILQPGDVEKALATAQAIGDDRLQTAARGYAVPDSFTHGSSPQRQKWLTAGLKSGDINDCDTFSN